jgi:hypothetical protein
MPTVRQLLAFTLPMLLLMLTLSSATGFAANQHLVPASQLAADVADRVAKQDADRAAVRAALARPEVQSVASSMGVDLARATAAVDTMSAADLERAANAARDVNQQLVGGASTIVISTTAIIIILLLVVILVVALK